MPSREFKGFSESNVHIQHGQSMQEKRYRLYIVLYSGQTTLFGPQPISSTDGSVGISNINLKE